jgi:hypothetical protein
VQSRKAAVQNGQVTCVVEASPEVVDAGAKITLHGGVSCVPSCDVRGQALLIKDHAGDATGKLEFVDFGDEANETNGEFVVTAPDKPGAYIWSAVFPAFVKKGVSYPEASAPISFMVKPHTVSVVAWDTPSAIVAGERFGTKVGIKCSSACNLTNRELRVYDHHGTSVFAVTLTGDRWPGTTRLYFAEVELEAPLKEGLYTWSVTFAGTDVGLSHDEGSTHFGVRVVGRPEYVLKIEAVDKISQTPLSGAHVVMHPYRVVANERGTAEMRVAKGEYQLFISQTRYLTLSLPVEVTTDMTARVELELEPVTERN